MAIRPRAQPRAPQPSGKDVVGVVDLSVNDGLPLRELNELNLVRITVRRHGHDRCELTQGQKEGTEQLDAHAAIVVR